MVNEICEKCEPVQTKPSPQPLVDTAAFLFRKGTTSAEKDMRPDANLVFEMRDRKLRVHDILNHICSGQPNDEVFVFLEWYDQTYKAWEK